MSFFYSILRESILSPSVSLWCKTQNDGQVRSEVHTVHGIYRRHISSLYKCPRCFFDSDAA